MSPEEKVSRPAKNLIVWLFRFYKMCYVLFRLYFHPCRYTFCCVTLPGYIGKICFCWSRMWEVNILTDITTKSSHRVPVCNLWLILELRVKKKYFKNNIFRHSTTVYRFLFFLEKCNRRYYWKQHVILESKTTRWRLFNVLLNIREKKHLIRFSEQQLIK